MMGKRRKGLSALESTVLIAVVVAAMLVMQIYVKAAVSGRWKTVADTFGGGQQYEPGVTVVSP